MSDYKSLSASLFADSDVEPDPCTSPPSTDTDTDSDPLPRTPIHGPQRELNIALHYSPSHSFALGDPRAPPLSSPRYVQNHEEIGEVSPFDEEEFMKWLRRDSVQEVDVPAIEEAMHQIFLLWLTFKNKGLKQGVFQTGVSCCSCSSLLSFNVPFSDG